MKIKNASVQTKDFDIGLTQFMSTHNISPQVAECLTDISKNFVVDSPNVKNMSAISTEGGSRIYAVQDRVRKACQ